ncbi:MAG: Omp28-related outer membrane protein, partial [Bacteroidota bacterium]
MKRANVCRAAMIMIAMMIGSKGAWAQYPRTILIEEFTSVTCVNCPQATESIDAIIKAQAGKVVSIRYHENIPTAGDPWYAANVPQNQARKEFYSVIALPYGKLDGGAVSVLDKEDINDRITERMTTQSPVKVEVTQARAEDKVTVTVKVTTGDIDLTGGTYKLHVAALEAHIHDETVKKISNNNGETNFSDVMRTLLPTTDGMDLTVGSNQNKTYTFTYTLGAGWQPDQMYSVAFVQNSSTAEVLQSAYSPKPVSAAPADDQNNLLRNTLGQSVPNPASADNVIASYSLGAGAHVRFDLYNAAGQLLRGFD